MQSEPHNSPFFTITNTVTAAKAKQSNIMGSGRSRVEYRTDPALLQQLQAANQNIAKLQAQSAADRAAMQAKLDAISADYNKMAEELKKEKDPKKFKENEKKLFDNLVGYIEEKNMGGDLFSSIKICKRINYCFVGKVSVGKSFLINAFFGDLKAESGCKLASF